MPKLYLLRHAEASGGFNLPDKERPLTDHGISQATLITPHLIDIDIVYCSSATRTQMTLKAVIDGGVEINDQEILDNLYNAPADILLQTIKESDTKNILVIAHNPGIHQLAAGLTADGEVKKINHLMSMYPPASLSIFDCDIENWRDLKLNQNRLVDFILKD